MVDRDGADVAVHVHVHPCFDRGRGSPRPERPGSRSAACLCRRSSELSRPKPAIEKGVVDGLAVWQQNNSHIAVVHLRHERPTTDPAIFLNLFTNRGVNRAIYPLVTDRRVTTSRSRTPPTSVVRRHQAPALHKERDIDCSDSSSRNVPGHGANEEDAEGVKR